MSLDISMLNPFHADLDRSGHLLRLVKQFREFAADPVPDATPEGDSQWEAAEKLHGSAALVRTDLPILAGSIMLYICGRFEFFVRELIASIGDEIASTSADYDSLPAALRAELLARTLEVAQNPQRFGHTPSSAEKLLVTLSESFQPHEAGKPVLISSSVLAVTEANMTQRMLSDVFKRVNIASIWPEIGKQAAMKVHLNKSTDSECTKAAQNELDRMMKERNGVAHPTGTTTFPDPDQVLSAVEFLRVLSSTLVDLAKIPRVSPTSGQSNSS